MLLALQFGLPPHELAERLLYQDFLDYMKLVQQQPFGLWREDLRSALSTQAILQGLSGNIVPTKAYFMPEVLDACVEESNAPQSRESEIENSAAAMRALAELLKRKKGKS